MIDWAALVANSALSLPKNEDKEPCSDSIGRNKPEKTEKVGTAESLSPVGFPGFVPTVPIVPTCFEGPRVEEQENRSPLSFLKPVGDVIEGQSAPHKKACESSCRTCANLGRPGLSDGHCGGRDDLPPAYGPGHPLRKLPADGGASCPAWVLHPFM